MKPNESLPVGIVRPHKHDRHLIVVAVKLTIWISGHRLSRDSALTLYTSHFSIHEINKGYLHTRYSGLLLFVEIQEIDLENEESRTHEIILVGSINAISGTNIGWPRHY